MNQSAGGEVRLAGTAGPVPDTATSEPAPHLALARTGPPALSRSEIENIHHLLPYLSYSGAQLAVGGIPVTRLWDGLRPMLLYMPDRAVENYRSISAAFGRYFDVTATASVSQLAQQT
jgi:hypothetical protein